MKEPESAKGVILGLLLLLLLYIIFFAPDLQKLFKETKQVSRQSFICYNIIINI
jgi:hypothetical protein